MLFEVVVLVFTLTGIWMLVNSRRFKNYPPGPSPIFPLVGNIPQLIFYKTEKSYESLDHISRDYGPLVFLKMGMLNQVVVQDLDLSRQLLSSDMWIDRPFDVLIGDRSFGKPLGVIFNFGDNWKEMRRFTTRTLRDFGFGRNKSMESVIEEEISILTENLDTYSTSGRELCMHQFFTVSILNVLWSMVAGVRFAHDDGRLKKLIKLLDETTKNTPVETNIAQMFPILWNVVKRTKKIRDRSVFHEEMQKFFKEIIKERRDTLSYKGDAKDFIDVFLQEIDRQEEKESSGNFSTNIYTDEQFIVTVYDLFVAGAETTSNTLEFAILFMALNPEVQARVQKEIQAVVGSNRRPTLEDRTSLPFTEATLLEIQRLASVIPILVRSASEDTTLSGYNIPKGTVAGVNLHSIHRSKETWDDPENFIPERFLQPDGKLNKNGAKILPFGLGKRICLGESLAKASLFTYFASVIQMYQVRTSPNHEKPTIEPVNGFTLSPKCYYVVLKKHEN